MVQRFPAGKNYNEDLCQHVTYAYGTNPYDGTNAVGRLASIAYPVCAIGPTASVTETYTYTPAGLVTTKAMGISQPYLDFNGGWDQAAYSVQASYTYTGWGAVSSVTLPTQWTANCGNCTAWVVPVTYSYGFDGAGRPNSMVDNNPNSPNGWSTTWVQNVQYDYAGRLSSWQRYAGTFYAYWGDQVDTGRIETLAYNVSGQLTTMNWSVNSVNQPYVWSAPTGIQYVYSPTRNNGQITQSVQSISGQTVTYQYDALKRVISAAAAPISGTTPAALNQGFTYDGFGNLTAMVANGVTTPIPVNAATNRLSNASYDANGNMTSGAGATFVYDEANRIGSATEVSGGTEYYNYAPDGKRVVRAPADGSAPE